MKLNYGCVRDLLLVLESDIKYVETIDDVLTKKKILNNPSLEKYSKNEILYHIKQLDEAGFIDAKYFNIDGASPILRYISDITWEGHKFLNNIRDEKTFSKVIEKITNSVGSASISIVADLAKGYIKGKLGL